MFFIQQISYKRGRKTCFCLHFARSSVVLVAMPMQRVSPWVWQAPIKLCKWAQISIVLAKCVILIHIFPNCLLSLLHCWTVSNVHHMSISFEITILWKCLCSVIRKGKSSSYDSFQTNAHTHTFNERFTGKRSITRSVKAKELRALCLFSISTSHSTLFTLNSALLRLQTIYGELVTHESIQLKMQFGADWLEKRQSAIHEPQKLSLFSVIWSRAHSNEKSLLNADVNVSINKQNDDICKQ